MMPHEEMPHDDEMQDESMIKEVLQRIIDEMDGMEAKRIHPKVEVMHLSGGSDGIPNPNENSAETPEQAEPEQQQNQHEELDPTVLKTLLEEAEGNETSSQSTDDFLDLPPEIVDAIRNKRRAK